VSAVTSAARLADDHVTVLLSMYWKFPAISLLITE
jgi:hypothetical protein